MVTNFIHQSLYSIPDILAHLDDLNFVETLISYEKRQIYNIHLKEGAIYGSFEKYPGAFNDFAVFAEVVLRIV